MEKLVTLMTCSICTCHEILQFVVFLPISNHLSKEAGGKAIIFVLSSSSSKNLIPGKLAICNHLFGGGCHRMWEAIGWPKKSLGGGRFQNFGLGCERLRLCQSVKECGRICFKRFPPKRRPQIDTNQAISNVSKPRSDSSFRI